MRRLRVFLADDHLVLRDGLALLIDAQPDMEVVGSAADGRDVVQQVTSCKADVIVMDVSMPHMNGTQATQQVRQNCPDVQVVALTRHSEMAYVRQLLQAGARGYVLKQAAADELLAAIRSVTAGGTYLDSTIANRTANHFVQSHTSRSNSHDIELSEREQEVVRSIAHGYSNKEIAAQLGISVKTVDTYKSRAMEKLELHSRAALVRYALEQGWLDQG